MQGSTSHECPLKMTCKLPHGIAYLQPAINQWFNFFLLPPGICPSRLPISAQQQPRVRCQSCMVSLSRSQGAADPVRHPLSHGLSTMPTYNHGAPHAPCTNQPFQLAGHLDWVGHRCPHSTAQDPKPVSKSDSNSYSHTEPNTNTPTTLRDPPHLNQQSFPSSCIPPLLPSPPVANFQGTLGCNHQTECGGCPLGGPTGQVRAPTPNPSFRHLQAWAPLATR